jgi:hypothetical protein
VFIVGIEHYTAVLGQWILDAHQLDEAGADPAMMDLLRWHGAGEVEHRSVAFDVYQHRPHPDSRPAYPGRGHAARTPVTGRPVRRSPVPPGSRTPPPGARPAGHGTADVPSRAIAER